MIFPRLLRGPVFALLCAIAAGAAAQDATLERARELIAAKQAKAAYELLAPLETARAGEPEFDYLLGLAAIDAGERTRGIFALERVLAVRPDHAQARAEIARAYFLIGENRVARAEFEAVKRAAPPDEVVASIDGFLDAIEQRERAAGSGVAGYVEATFGFDDNVNSATGTRSFGIAAFPGLAFNLAANASRQRDDFLGLAGGIFARQKLDETLSLVGNASFDQRMNGTLDRFDTGSLNASGGLSIKPGKDDEILVAAQVQTFSVDHARFRDALGLVGQWRRNIGERDQLTGYAQYTRLAYPTQRSRNADRRVLGANWAHTFGGTRAPVAFLGFNVGEEAERGTNVPHFGHTLWGVRVGGQILLTPNSTLSASVSYEDRRYGGPDPLFLRKRMDRETQVRVAIAHALSKAWTLTPQLSFTDARSNVIVNRYDRTAISITARYTFQ